MLQMKFCENESLIELRVIKCSEENRKMLEVSPKVSPEHKKSP